MKFHFSPKLVRLEIVCKNKSKNCQYLIILAYICHMDNKFYEEYLVHRELQIMQERSAIEELKKYYTEKDNQLFLGYTDFIEKNKK